MIFFVLKWSSWQERRNRIADLRADYWEDVLLLADELASLKTGARILRRYSKHVITAFRSLKRFNSMDAIISTASIQHSIEALLVRTRNMQVKRWISSGLVSGTADGVGIT